MFHIPSSLITICHVRKAYANVSSFISHKDAILTPSAVRAAEYYRPPHRYPRVGALIDEKTAFSMCVMYQMLGGKISPDQMKSFEDIHVFVESQAGLVLDLKFGVSIGQGVLNPHENSSPEELYEYWDEGFRLQVNRFLTFMNKHLLNPFRHLDP